jgi:hypothetical protein
MKITDDLLMAYADGELDEKTRAQVALAVAQDPSLAERVQQHQQLRAQLGDAFAPVLDERIPDRLRSAINGSVHTDTTVVELDSFRQAKNRPKRQWAWPQWSAIAASLLLGVLVGRMVDRTDEASVVARGDYLVASGALARALDSKLSNEGGEQLIGMSFRSADGEYCRSFTSRGAASVAGLACRLDDAWRVRVLSQASSDETPYRTASSALPPAVLAEIDAAMSGEPLTVEEEKAARERRWK